MALSKEREQEIREQASRGIRKAIEKITPKPSADDVTQRFDLVITAPKGVSKKIVSKLRDVLFDYGYKFSLTEMPKRTP